jgi:hypothetical protein
MRYGVLKKAKTQVRVNNPHVSNYGVQQEKKQTVPPFVRSGQAGINTLDLIYSVHTAHVLHVLQVHGSCRYFFPTMSKFPPHKQSRAVCSNWCSLCGKKNDRLLVFPHYAAQLFLIMHLVIYPTYWFFPGGFSLTQGLRDIFPI